MSLLKNANLGGTYNKNKARKTGTYICEIVEPMPVKVSTRKKTTLLSAELKVLDIVENSGESHSTGEVLSHACFKNADYPEYFQREVADYARAIGAQTGQWSEEDEMDAAEEGEAEQAEYLDGIATDLFEGTGEAAVGAMVLVTIYQKYSEKHKKEFPTVKVSPLPQD